MQRSEQAKKNFMSGLNCSQSVLLGGGVGRMREICGTVSAMMLVLGCVFYDADHPTTAEKSALYALEQELADRFRQKYGSIVCRELLKGIVSDASPAAEARTAEYYRKRPCPDMCAEAAAMLEGFLKEKGKL